MKKTLFTLLFLAFSAFAQTGISKSAEGIRVPTAFTQGQGVIYTSLGMESISDGEPLVLDGEITGSKGEVLNASQNAVSMSFSAFIAYGALDNLEIGACIPVHYDGDIGEIDIGGAGMGDFQFYLKGGLQTGVPLQLGGSFELYAPSGNNQTGYRPRHVWYVQGEETSNAYTSKFWSIAATLYATVYNFDILHWNNYIGILKSLGNSNLALLWGTGIVLFPKKIINFSLELSGETRLVSEGIPLSPSNDPLRLTPGIRLHLPRETDFTVGIDLGLGFVKEVSYEDGLPVSRSAKNKTFEYHVAGSPKIGLSISLNKTLDFSWKDSDHDGVFDRDDLCPNTSFGMTVNQRGCPVDEDQDGILNIVDDCPTTPNGISVDFRGCPFDEDRDGVPDYLDQCARTPEGQAVNKKGCIQDSDGDGIDDNSDKCAKSIPGERVDKDGCPMDDDHDGVLNENDNCPQTPTNFSVDQFGCPLDFDKDGVPDILDNCPNSLDNEIVGENGCPLDDDMDGVPDSKDKCPNTPAETAVGINGCPTDRDQDGVPDFLDKCPNTQPGIPVDSIGCNRDSDKDGIPDFMDKCPKTFPNVKVDGNGCPVDKKNNLDAIAQRVKFLNGTNELQNSSYSALNDVILLMRMYKFKLTIVCSHQSSANAISEYFESKGFHDRYDVQIKPRSPIRFLIAE